MPKARAFFSSRSQSVTHASALLAVTALASNVLGLGRNLVFYRLIEPGQLDVYYASFRIADFLFTLLIFGTITSAFIPVVTELLSHDKEKEAHQATNEMLSWATLFFLVLIVVLGLAMPSIIHLVVPGFDPARLATTVLLSRLMLIQTVFFSWSFIIGGLLNGYRRFTSYAFAPLVYNGAIIIGGLMAPRFGIKGVIYAVILGSFLHFLIQFLEAYRLGFRPQPRFRLSPSLQETIGLMVPRSISQGMGQLVLIAYTNLASALQAGSIAIFSGMNDLQTTPTVIVGNSLATAFFPSLSRFVSKHQWEELNALLNKVVRSALFILLPGLAVGFILRAQVVRLYVGIGGFNWELTNIAIATFVFFLVGIIPASLVAILSRVFYALKDTRTPMVISLASGAVGIAAAFVGVHYLHYDVASLAFAESLISLLQCGAYVFVLHNRTNVSFSVLHSPKLLTNYIAGSLLAAGSSWVALRAVDAIYKASGVLSTNHIAGLLVQLAASGAIGVTVYWVYSTFMNKEEIRWVTKRTFSQDQ